MSTFHKLRVQNITQETLSTVSVSFQVPKELQEEYRFISGQYVNLKVTLGGQEIRRAYSICSSPNSNELRIAIKAVPNGVFSNFANEELQENDIIEVGVPEGKFTFEPNEDSQCNYAAFAAGSGITPIMSIIKSVLESEPKSTFVLVYGNKTSEETIFQQQFHDLQNQYVGRLFVHYVYSQSNKGDFFGRIDKAVINNVLFVNHNEKTFDKFYLCGPEDMINLVSFVLKEHNVKENDIKFELFTTSSAANDNTIIASGHSQLTVVLDDDEVSFEISQKQTILEAALKYGLDAPYSCQGGICSSCIARVTEGKAEMKKNQILTDAEIEEGLVLTCQAHSVTPTIKVDYDDI